MILVESYVVQDEDPDGPPCEDDDGHPVADDLPDHVDDVMPDEVVIAPAAEPSDDPLPDPMGPPLPPPGLGGGDDDDAARARLQRAALANVTFQLQAPTLCLSSSTDHSAQRSVVRRAPRHPTNQSMEVRLEPQGTTRMPSASAFSTSILFVNHLPTQDTL